MQALRDHVISQISEDRLQPLAYKLGLSQEVIDQLPVGKQGFELMLKEWLKSGQRKWHDLVVALRCPQVDDQRLSDHIARKLTDNGKIKNVYKHAIQCLIQLALSLCVCHS